jgi:LacI family transcriptional regulator
MLRRERQGEGRVTIKDIARLADVSVSTVSRVLNDRPDVSEESRRRVRAVIAAHHYVPNNTARDLVRLSSDAIGLIVRGVQNPFYTDIIAAVETALDAAGYTMVMRQIGFTDDELAVGAMMQREKRLRGVIFLGGRLNYTPREVAQLNVPFVLCSYTNAFGMLDRATYSSVSIDDERAAFDAVSELLRNGHTRVAALIADWDGSTISALRFRGYRRALREHGIPLRGELVISAGDSFAIEDAYRAVAEGLRRCDDFTALFAIADDMAIGAMRALREHGRDIPGDCSVIAIDGIVVSEYIHPMLTTLSQPREELGRRSVELLLANIEGRGAHRQLTLPTSFRPGASVRAI